MQILIHLYPHHTTEQVQQLYDQAIAFLTFEHAVKLVFTGEEINPALLDNVSVNRRFNGLLLYGAEFYALRGHPALHASELDFDITTIKHNDLQNLVNESEVLI